MVHVGARLPGYRQISVEAHSVDEILGALESVAAGVAALMPPAEAAALRQRGAEVVAGLRERLRRVQARVAGRPRPRVVCLEWLDPFYCSGHWVPELVALPCSFDLPGALAAARGLAALPGVRELPAAQGGRLWAVDSERYFSGSSPRVVDGVELLAALFHPDVAGDLLPAGAAAPVEIA